MHNAWFGLISSKATCNKRMVNGKGTEVDFEVGVLILLSTNIIMIYILNYSMYSQALGEMSSYCHSWYYQHLIDVPEII